MRGRRQELETERITARFTSHLRYSLDVKSAPEVRGTPGLQGLCFGVDAG